MTAWLTSAPVAWSVIGYVAIIVGGRLLLVREALFDQLINRLFLWSLAALLLYRCTLTPTITSLANQLALGCILMTTTYMATIGRSADAAAEADPGIVWRYHRLRSLIALGATVTIVVAGTSARNDGRLVAMNPDWEGIVTGLAFGVPLLWHTVVYGRLGIRELRSGDPPVWERLVLGIMFVSTAYTWLCEGLSISQSFTGWPALGPQLPRIAASFTLCVIVNVTVVAVPLVRLLGMQAGLDSAARSCRRLSPLWRDLTAAVPEIVLSPAEPRRVDATARLLRMTVEIRDALLHLGPYLPAAPDVPGPEPVRRGKSDWTTIAYAQQLAHAAHARKYGLRPIGSGGAGQLPWLADDFDTELRQLLDLARVWSATTLSGSPTVQPGSASPSRPVFLRHRGFRFPPR
ncbi:MAB_1171c family putative transporter [Nocardia sp. NPDC046473]|uniref:MAB_1171c family putative transporter n=1 Tax=Nocardia sp. NPDC046473 TaxID=3155733 RepID=UPI0033D2C04F